MTTTNKFIVLDSIDTDEVLNSVKERGDRPKSKDKEKITPARTKRALFDAIGVHSTLLEYLKDSPLDKKSAYIRSEMKSLEGEIQQVHSDTTFNSGRVLPLEDCIQKLKGLSPIKVKSSLGEMKSDPKECKASMGGRVEVESRSQSKKEVSIAWGDGAEGEMAPRFAVFKSESGSVGVDEEDEEPSGENQRNFKPPSHPIVQVCSDLGILDPIPNSDCGVSAKNVAGLNRLRLSSDEMKQIEKTVKATGSALKAIVGSFVQNIEEPDILIRECAEAGVVGSETEVDEGDSATSNEEGTEEEESEVEASASRADIEGVSSSPGGNSAKAQTKGTAVESSIPSNQRFAELVYLHPTAQAREDPKT
ncbi:hypothetical protein U1Q18_051790 [Sarracenia purpurea var. burkii]